MQDLIPLKPLCLRLGLSIQHEIYRCQKLGLEVVSIRHPALDGRMRNCSAITRQGATMWLAVIAEASLQPTTKLCRPERKQIANSITAELRSVNT